MKYIRSAVASSSSIYTNTPVVILTMLTTYTAIMSATLPCLRQFLAMFDSGLIGEYNESNNNNTQNGTMESQSFAMVSMSREPARSPKSGRLVDERGVRLRPDQNGDMRAEITAARRCSVDCEGSGRAIIKKTQAWEISYG